MIHFSLDQEDRNTTPVLDCSNQSKDCILALPHPQRGRIQLEKLILH